MTDTTGPDTENTPAAADQPDPTTSPASEPGTELDRWRSHAREWEKRAKANADAAKRLAELEDAHRSETDRAIHTARTEASTEAWGRARSMLVSSAARALAASARFNDPADAVTMLGPALADITVDDTGVVDEAALRSLLDQLAADKPYLVAGEPAPTAPTAPSPVAGAGVVGQPGPATPGDEFAAFILDKISRK